MVLDDEQLKVVEHGDGPLLVSSGPGSGKTRVITARAARLVADGVPPERILVVTFTRKAADEMSKRLQDLVGRTATDMNIGTFHAMCLRLLRQHGCTRDILDRDRQARLMSDLLANTDLAVRTRDVLLDISYLKSRMITPQEALRASSDEFEEDLSNLYHTYQQILDDLSLMDFDDMIWLVLKASGNLQRKLTDAFDYIMVDEFQDTNLMQFELLRLLGSRHGNVVVVGDEDQSIYGFRGADGSLTATFLKEYNNSKVVRLSLNYRSNPAVVKLGSDLISKNRRVIAKELHSAVGFRGQPIIEVYEGADRTDEAQYLARMAKELLAYGTVGVLARTQAHVKQISAAMTSASLPHSMVGAPTQLPNPELVYEDAPVTVMTIHASKGLEFDSVLVGGLEEKMLPHYHSIEDGDSAIEEERRLLYVAVTRAKQNVVLTRAKWHKGMATDPSRFLNDLNLRR